MRGCLHEHPTPTVPNPFARGKSSTVARLREYLSAHVPALGPVLAIEQFPHGHSNLTYLIRDGEREWVLRRPPFGNRVKTAHDMGREYRLLSRLCHVYPPAPAPLLYCEDESILGAPVLPDGTPTRRDPPRLAVRDRTSSPRIWCGGSARRWSTAWPICMRSITTPPAWTTWASHRATSSARSRDGPSATTTPAPDKCPTWSAP